MCVFPGQGSQRVGMGRDLAEVFAVARRTLSEADDHLGFALSRLCADGPAETLALTEYAQPAILAASVCAYRVLQEVVGLEPAATAGHSLGEWSALVAAGAIDFGDALRGVRERGRLMQEAVPIGTGAMVAVLGLDPDAVLDLCHEAAQGQVVAPANLNGGGQVVVAGHTRAVDRLARLAVGRQARVLPLDVSAPFHCALMAPAAAGLDRHLATTVFREPRVPVVTSVEARLVHGAGELRALLVHQVTSPVRWEDTVRVLEGFGAGVCLEVGPGRVLSGLMRRIAPQLQAIPAGDAAGIRAAEAAVR